MSADAIFAALGHPIRRTLLDRLRTSGGQTQAALSDGLGVSRQAVQRHLVLLKASDLVVTVRHGREKHHYLNPVPLQSIAQRWIQSFEGMRLQALPVSR